MIKGLSTLRDKVLRRTPKEQVFVEVEDVPERGVISRPISPDDARAILNWSYEHNLRDQIDYEWIAHCRCELTINGQVQQIARGDCLTFRPSRQIDDHAFLDLMLKASGHGVARWRLDTPNKVRETEFMLRWGDTELN